MITANNFSYSFPQKDLFNNISFTLEEGQHCAFIGTSGSGKSTLLDIIMNPDRYLYDRTLDIATPCRIGYVSQFSQAELANEVTVFEYIAEEFIELQDELSSIYTEMETSSDLDALLEHYQETLDSYNAIGGDDFEQVIRRKLNLANLNKLENQMVSKLSGGEFKIIQVIREMLNSPDLMIMDEPDVFLDFDNLNSLKNLINSHKGTMLVVTHNRYLLNNCFNKILHLENMELQDFDGTYIDYNFSLLQRKIELQELSTADTEEIERNEKIIERLRSKADYDADAARGKALKARIKIKDRLEARRVKDPFVDIKQPDIQLDTDNVIEDTLVLTVSDYSVAFDEILIEHVNLEIKSNEKVALIGANGTGKTTLLRDIYKNNHPSIQMREDSKVAYLSQLQGEILNEANTILNEFLDAGFKTNNEVQSYLLNYGFEEEHLKQKIDSLSGGEKNILQVAKVTATKATLLLLDEPTSHLDTYSQIALEKAIKEFNGAVLMISHDFYTIVNCVDSVLIIDNKTVRKMTVRKFRKIIYAKYFDKDYLEFRQQKMSLETKIARALKDNDIPLAKELSEELEELIK
ncbi:MAG: ABC-F family ATP-binding cassette domain-containing protein [Clostridiaceae bacterium]|jgi:ATP-binding cassette subfamily F protein 3|nr:ABC-F family ATP-binding cassette domain-containing protein [Clostridiaceae bacterium]